MIERRLEVREVVTISTGRVFQAEGMAKAKVLGWEYVCALEEEQDQWNWSGVRERESCSCVQRGQSGEASHLGPQDEKVEEEQNLTFTL